jgi:hypothetical protein
LKIFHIGRLHKMLLGLARLPRHFQVKCSIVDTSCTKINWIVGLRKMFSHEWEETLDIASPRHSTGAISNQCFYHILQQPVLIIYTKLKIHKYGQCKLFLSWVYIENTAHSQLIIKQDVGNCHILRQSAG